MTNPSNTDWASLTMADLRKACKERGIAPGKRGNTKPGIIAILQEWAAAQDGAQGEPEGGDDGSRLIGALEDLYRAIRRRHSDLPALMIVTGSGVRGRTITWGHHRPGAWKQANSEGRLAELFISGEALDKGAASVLWVMLHEAAHVLAEVWEVKDTTRRGAYHNHQFVMVAEHLGMYWPEGTSPDAGIGYSHVQVKDETELEYLDELVALDMAINASLDTLARLGVSSDGADPKKGGHTVKAPQGEGDTTTSTRNNVKLVCDCAKPRIIRMSRKEMGNGPVSCGLCGSDFHEA